MNALLICLYAPHCALLHRLFFYLHRINIAWGNCQMRRFFREIFGQMRPCPIFYAFNFAADIGFSTCVCAPDWAALRRLFIFLQKMDIAWGNRQNIGFFGLFFVWWDLVRFFTPSILQMWTRSQFVCVRLIELHRVGYFVFVLGWKLAEKSAKNWKISTSEPLILGWNRGTATDCQEFRKFYSCNIKLAFYPG